MSPLKTIAYRLPPDLIDRIDDYAAVRTRVDGRPCDRSTAIRVLLEKALDMKTPKAKKTSETITDTFEPPEPQIHRKPEEEENGSWSGWGGQAPQRRKASRTRKAKR